MISWESGLHCSSNSLATSSKDLSSPYLTLGICILANFFLPKVTKINKPLEVTNCQHGINGNPTLTEFGWSGQGEGQVRCPTKWVTIPRTFVILQFHRNIPLEEVLITESGPQVRERVCLSTVLIEQSLVLEPTTSPIVNFLWLFILILKKPTHKYGQNLFYTDCVLAK